MPLAQLEDFILKNTPILILLLAFCSMKGHVLKLKSTERLWSQLQ